MNQDDVLALLKSFGGRAIQRQLTDAVMPQYPTSKRLHVDQLINRKLNILRKWGEVTTLQVKPVVWVVIEK